MEEVKLEKGTPLQTSGQQQQQQQQQQSHQNGDKKTQHQSQSPHQLHRPPSQLKPEDAGDASRSSLSSIESIEVVHVRTPNSLASRGKRRRGRDCGGTRSTIRYLRHGLLAISVVLFITGFLLTVGHSAISNIIVLSNEKRGRERERDREREAGRDGGGREGWREGKKDVIQYAHASSRARYMKRITMCL